MYMINRCEYVLVIVPNHVVQGRHMIGANTPIGIDGCIDGCINPLILVLIINTFLVKIYLF